MMEQSTKKTIKKGLFLITMCMLAMTLALAACAKNKSPSEPSSPPDEPPVPSVTLSAHTLELGLFESATLEATLSNLTGEVVWASSQENIATVSDGVVTAYDIGSTVVTATVGEYSDTCTVNVGRGTKNLSLDNLDLILPLTLGTEWPLDLRVFLDGEEFNDAEVAVATEGDYISLTDEGVITANKLGTQTITVTVTYNGLALVEETVTVNVVEIGEIVTGLHQNKLSLKSQSTLADTDAEFDLSTFAAKVNGKVVNKTITYTPEDSTIVAVEGTKLIGKKRGSTTVTAAFTADSGERYDVTFTVDVTNAASTAVYDAQYAKSNNGTIGFDTAKFNGFASADVTEVFDANGTSLVHSITGSTLSVQTAEAGHINLVFTANNIDYTVPVLVADYVLTDFANWMDMLLGGYKYMILESDITYSGSMLAYNGTVSTFTGTFDGLGNTITGAYISHGLFQYAMSATSVVKDVTFKNLKVLHFGVLGVNVYGEMDNVHITADLSDMATAHPSLIANNVGKDFTLTNCTFDIMAVPNLNAMPLLEADVSANIGNADLENVEITSVGNIASFTVPSKFADKNVSIKDRSRKSLKEVTVQSFKWTVDIASYGFSGEVTASDVNGSPIACTKSGNTLTFTYTGPMALFLVLSDGNKSVKVGVIVPEFTLPAQEVEYDTGEVDYVKAVGATSANGKVTGGKITLDKQKFTPAITGTISQIFVGGKLVESNVNGNNLEITVENGGLKEIAIYTDEKAYLADVLVVDYVLTDFANWMTMLTGGYQYMVLESDITYSDSMLAYNGASGTFTGTFDGMGKTITGANISHGLFQYTMTATSVVKNVTFKNLKVLHFGLLGVNVYGEMDNVHITADLSDMATAHPSLIANNMGSGFTLTNCTFDIMDVPYLNDMPLLEADVSTYIGNADLENVEITSVGNIKAFQRPAKWNGKNVVIQGRSDMNTVTVSDSQWTLDVSSYNLGNNVSVADVNGNPIACTKSDNTLTFEYTGPTAMFLVLTGNGKSVKVGVIVPLYEISSIDVTYEDKYLLIDGEGKIHLDALKVKDADGNESVNIGTDIKSVFVNTTSVTPGFTAPATLDIPYRGTGETEIIVTTASAAYKLTIIVADYALEKFEDWYKMLSGGYQYMVLAKDITYEGGMPATGGTTNPLDYGNLTSQKFIGTFDGLGYTITNAQLTHGLFGDGGLSTTGTSVVKNVTFENLKIGYRGILGDNLYGTFKNVHVTADLGSQNSKYQILGGVMYPVGTKYFTIEDSTFTVTAATATATRLVENAASLGKNATLKNVTITSVGSIENYQYSERWSNVTVKQNASADGTGGTDVARTLWQG